MSAGTLGGRAHSLHSVTCPHEALLFRGPGLSGEPGRVCCGAGIRCAWTGKPMVQTVLLTPTANTWPLRLAAWTSSALPKWQPHLRSPRRKACAGLSKSPHLGSREKAGRALGAGSGNAPAATARALAQEEEHRWGPRSPCSRSPTSPGFPGQSGQRSRWARGPLPGVPGWGQGSLCPAPNGLHRECRQKAPPQRACFLLRSQQCGWGGLDGHTCS